MKLTTPVLFPSVAPKIGYEQGLVFMGSCFSEHIGGWMADLKFLASANITGIAYNPVSLAKHIELALAAEQIDASQLKESSGQYVHTDFHSRFNQTDREAYVAQTNDAVTELKDKLLQADTLFLTFGTAIAFEEKASGQIVNNCHKLPSTNFEQRFLDEAEMQGAVLRAIDALTAVNPDIRIFLTVSPIRHLRHGATDNQRSKARLIRLCEMLCHDRPMFNYLPIYEYVMDELRDYRYYRHDDMIHLSGLGLEMVREKVRMHLISPASLELMSRIEKWKAMKSHRVMQDHTPDALAFTAKLEAETAALEALLPGRF